MSYLPPPEWLSGLELNKSENIEKPKLLEMTTRRSDDSAYIATIYRPSISLEQQRCDISCAPIKGISYYFLSIQKNLFERVD